MILDGLGAEMIAVANPTTGEAARDWGRRLSQARRPAFTRSTRAKGSITVDLAVNFAAFIRYS